MRILFHFPQMIILMVICIIYQASVKKKKILPDYSYIIKDKRYHKFNFRKSKFDDIDNLTEREYMFNKKIYRIYDSGKIRWVL